MGIFTKENYLDNSEIRSILLEKGVSESLSNEILRAFWFKDVYNSLISYKPYLDIFIEYLEQTNYLEFKLPVFYTYLFQKLYGNNFKELIPLAFIYELIHANQIEESIFDSILLNKKYPFTKAYLTDKGLMEILTDDKTKKKYVGWKHHRLSEFLVAEKLLGSSSIIEDYEKYAVFKQKGIPMLKQSWFGVLYFLFLSNKRNTITSWCVEFLQKHQRSLTEDLAEYLTNVPLESEETKLKVFKLVYKTYGSKGIWFPVWARTGLGKIATKTALTSLKKDIEEQDTPEKTYTNRGNVISIIGNILEEQPDLLSNAEKTFWKTRMVEYAKSQDGNGVLQRHCLSALTFYKDAVLVEELSVNFINKDSLVREAFIQFCYDSAPNSFKTIDYLIEAIKQGMDIYARHGLYEITSPEAIKYLLEKSSKDTNFLKRLIDKESIFNGEDEKGDQRLIENIKKTLQTDATPTLTLLKQVVFAIAKLRNVYHIEKSYLIESITLMIAEADPDFWKELIKAAKNNMGKDENVWAVWDTYEEILVWLVSENNLKGIHDEILKLPKDGQHVFEMILRNYRWRVNDISLYEKAIKDSLLEPAKVVPQVTNSPFESNKTKKYEEFKRLLEPGQGKYQPEVFDYYLRNESDLKDVIQPEDTERLMKLAIESNLDLIDPKKFKVKYQNTESKSGPYTISSVHFYFGAIMRLGLKLFPEKLPEYRQKFIDFLVFAFTEDLMTILEIVTDIKESELTFVYGVYSDKDNDARYLIPGSFTHFISLENEKGNYLQGAIPILKSFVEDKDIEEYSKRQALENLSELDRAIKVVGKGYFQDVFKNMEFPFAKDIANTSLIKIYNDPQAIKWRFQKLRNKVVEAKAYIAPEPLIAHEVSDFEEELTETALANPLYDLSPEYYKRFQDLLDFAIGSDNSGNLNYITYVWRIYTKYVERVSSEYDFNYYFSAERHIKRLIKKNPKLKWFWYEFERVYVRLSDKFGALTIEKAVQNE
ncbi:MAG: hypothetical protein WAX66_02160 [Patescibacteria group bacterium]